MKTLIVFALSFLPAVFCGASDVSSQTVRCDGSKYQYVLFSPAQKQALPAILLLHGAGDHAPDFLAAWRSFARKQQIVLIAPELPRDPKFEDAAPNVFRCVVDDARNRRAIDPHRLYVFGNSMGGYLAYDAAMFDSEYFAAVAVHAMGIAKEYASIVDRAKRKMPIAIYIGVRDQLVPIARVRQTRDLLTKAGFSVHYLELEGHDHNYYALSDQINADAWKFLSEQLLP